MLKNRPSVTEICSPEAAAWPPIRNWPARVISTVAPLPVAETVSAPIQPPLMCSLLPVPKFSAASRSVWTGERTSCEASSTLSPSIGK